jgi:hypothetical protein
VASQTIVDIKLSANNRTNMDVLQPRRKARIKQVSHVLEWFGYTARFCSQFLTRRDSARRRMKRGGSSVSQTPQWPRLICRRVDGKGRNVQRRYHNIPGKVFGFAEENRPNLFPGAQPTNRRNAPDHRPIVERKERTVKASRTEGAD